MNVFILLFLITAQEIFLAENAKIPFYPSQKIIGSTLASKGQFPYHVLLERDGFVTCAGGILKENWILTADFCTTKEYKQIVYAGIYFYPVRNESGLQSSTVKRIFYHSAESRKTLIDDIALIELEVAFKFNEYVQPIALPIDKNDCIKNGDATVSGWGFINTWLYVLSPNLKFATLPVIPHQQCKDMLVKAKMPESAQKLNESSMICTGMYEMGQATCFGDGGAPLVQKNVNAYPKYKIYGVTSWAPYPCGVNGSPSVYFSVCYHVEWINAIINGNISEQY